MRRLNNIHEINSTDQNSSIENDSEFFIDTLFNNQNSNEENGNAIHIDKVSFLNTDRAFVTLNVGPSKTHIKFKIDTGSSVNIIPFKFFKTMLISNPLEAPDNKLTSYTGNMLTVRGKINLACEYKQRVIKSEFYVVDNSAPPLISLSPHWI